MRLNRRITEIWNDALNFDERDEFVASLLQNRKFEDTQEIKDYLGKIWDLAHMNVRSIVQCVRLTQASFAQLLGIPIRTVEDWCRGVANPPHYVRLWMQIMLELIDSPPYSVRWTEGE